MIVAEWVGGPHDGKRIALRSATETFRFALPPNITMMLTDDPSPLDIDFIEVRPRLTRDGWRLDWPKGV